jgi:transposase
MKPYSMDLRQRVLADCDSGMATKAVADKFTVSPAWVRRLKQRRRQTGETAPRRQRHGPRPGWREYGESLKQAVKDRPDSTLAELKDALGLAVCLSTVAFALKALGLSLKKK